MAPEQPQTDSLTGLLTRKAFTEQFKTVMEISRKTDRPAVLIYMDIDHFLEVNESYGHQAGDAVIAGVARLARETFGAAAILSRFGGDETAILLPGVEREVAFLTMERLRQAVEAQQTYEYEGKSWDIQVTISAGLAAFAADGRSDYELLRKADQALYRAKLAGRNQVRLAYDEKLTPKTSHYTQTQLERLNALALSQGISEAELLREAMDDLLLNYGVNDILS
jgi:diguanylate cyclase